MIMMTANQTPWEILN